MPIREADISSPSDVEFLERMLQESALGANESLPVAGEAGYVEFSVAYEKYRHQLLHGQGATLIAEEEGRPVGAAWYRFFPGYAFLASHIPELTIGVEADHRGQGVGKSLIEALAATAHDKGVAGISLNVEANNQRAQKLYTSLGFTAVRREGDGSYTMLRSTYPNQS